MRTLQSTFTTYLLFQLVYPFTNILILSQFNLCLNRNECYKSTASLIHILRFLRLEFNVQASAFGDEPRRMLRIIQRFGKHCSCHPQHTFTMKMATAKFAETLDNSKHSTRLIPESQSCTANFPLTTYKDLNSIRFLPNTGFIPYECMRVCILLCLMSVLNLLLGAGTV
jgi:hypothetical protein